VNLQNIKRGAVSILVGTIAGTLQLRLLSMQEAAQRLHHVLAGDDDGRWLAALELTVERITPGTNKRTHKPIDRADEATDSQWREAYALAALRLLAEQRDGLVSDIRRLCEYAHLEHGTSALRLAEVAHVSNGSTARWLREPMWSAGPRQSRWSCGQDQADGPRDVASVVSQGCGDVGVSRAA